MYLLLEILKQMQEGQSEKVNDPEIEARIAQYEMAFRMQSSVPELANVETEPKHVLDLYGPDATRRGSSTIPPIRLRIETV